MSTLLPFHRWRAHVWPWGLSVFKNGRGWCIGLQWPVAQRVARRTDYVSDARLGLGYYLGKYRKSSSE